MSCHVDVDKPRSSEKVVRVFLLSLKKKKIYSFVCKVGLPTMCASVPCVQCPRGQELSLQVAVSCYIDARVKPGPLEERPCLKRMRYLFSPIPECCFTILSALVFGLHVCLCGSDFGVTVGCEVSYGYLELNLVLWKSRAISLVPQSYNFKVKIKL